MTDIGIAVRELNGHSICLCREGEFLTDDGRGISPMMRFIAVGRVLAGFSAADIIVGKAAAMLFAKAGIVRVHGRVMSVSGRAYLESCGIPCTYDVLTEKIMNRQGTDICPMEKTVADIDDFEEGYKALKTRLEELRSGSAEDRKQTRTGNEKIQ